MSGSGGGGGGDWRPEPIKPASKPKGEREGEGQGTFPDPCNITEVTTLNSVNRNVLAGLRPNDQLSVVFQGGPPQRLVAQTQAGATAGSITSSSMLQIIQCIQAGHSYDAVVLSVREELNVRCGLNRDERHNDRGWSLPRAVHLA